MGLFLTPSLRICYQHVLPSLTRQITLLNISHNEVPTFFKVGGKAFCTKNFNKNVVTKRKDFKQKSAVIKENPAFPKSVFAAGHARRTALILKKKAGISDTEESSDYVEKKYASEVPDRPLTASEWKRLKEDSTRQDRFEIRMMAGLLSTDADINIAKSLLAYVAVDTGTVPYELLLRYLTVCVKGEHWAEMYDVYDIMKGRFRTLDTGAYSLLIKGFSMTERWEETLVLIDNISKLITPSSRNYSDAISGAVEHGHLATAWTLYDQLLEKGIHPNQETWKYLFEGGISNHENSDRLLAILEDMRDNQIYPQDNLAQVIRKWFECRPDQKWTGSISKVNPRGACQGCGSVMESIHLTEEDYADLKSSVMKNVIEGKDVFKKTTPEELEDFKRFVSKRPPFDVVIDGLNVAHTLGRGSQSETLLAVVSEFSQQGLSILVLGRKHMLLPTQNWNRHHMKQIQQKAHCFFTENISEDDPFLLYAALHSGNHCNFVSRDLMRDHKACLPSGPTRRLFFKWQRGHQLVLHNYAPGKRVRFQKIQSYDTIIQTTANTWHIPFDEDGVERCTHEVPEKWMCLTRQN